MVGPSFSAASSSTHVAVIVVISLLPVVTVVIVVSGLGRAERRWSFPHANETRRLL
jgi:hypothetical protein